MKTVRARNRASHTSTLVLCAGYPTQCCQSRGGGQCCVQGTLPTVANHVEEGTHQSIDQIVRVEFRRSSLRKCHCQQRTPSWSCKHMASQQGKNVPLALTAGTTGEAAAVIEPYKAEKACLEKRRSKFQMTTSDIGGSRAVRKRTWPPQGSEAGVT